MPPLNIVYNKGRLDLMTLFQKTSESCGWFESVGVGNQCDPVTRGADPAPRPKARRLKLKPYDLMPAQILNPMGASSVETIALEESDSELSLDGSMASMDVNSQWW